MGIVELKHDNLGKLLEGLSLLDGQDQERIINMVDTLDLTDKKVKNEIYSGFSPLKVDSASAYADGKI